MSKITGDHAGAQLQLQASAGAIFGLGVIRDSRENNAEDIKEALTIIGSKGDPEKLQKVSAAIYRYFAAKPQQLTHIAQHPSNYYAGPVSIRVEAD